MRSTSLSVISTPASRMDAAVLSMSVFLKRFPIGFILKIVFWHKLSSNWQ